MQRKTGQIKCWSCGKWIVKKGNLCPYCGKPKQKSRLLVEAREDRFITLSATWLVVTLLFSGVLWVVFRSPAIFCVMGLLLFLPGLAVTYLWTGMAGA